MSAKDSTDQAVDQQEVKLPKKCKETRYYYKHREEILARRKEKKLEDPEYQAKYEERQRKKAERDALEQERALKRELRKKVVEQLLNPTCVLSGAI
jgi:hypothetical protein